MKNEVEGRKKKKKTMKVTNREESRTMSMKIDDAWREGEGGR